MKILVTGGAGFIGSEYVRSLLTGRLDDGADHRVTVYDKLTYSGNLANLEPVADDPRYTFVRGDINDAELLDEVLPGHDAIVHFAAESHVDRSITGAADFVTTNVLGTQSLIDASRRAGVGRFVHVSTDEVYGSIDEGSWTEDWPLTPNSPYSAAKAGSDLLVLAAHRTHGFDAVVTRCSNNYGHYHFPEKMIPLFVTNLLDGGRVPLYGDGGNVRDWLHVSDHVRGIHLALTRGRAGEVYHIGGGTELTNKELTERLLEACGADWTSVDNVADRKGHDRRYSLDIGKIRAELGYTPQISFDEGLARTVAWYRENRAWWEPLKAKAAL
ncbi:MAG TPA: dTDP-glucose 4,6-dehydratase [Actinocrinis sp.]